MDFDFTILQLRDILYSYEEALTYWEKTKAPAKMQVYTQEIIDELKSAITRLQA